MKRRLGLESLHKIVDRESTVNVLQVACTHRMCHEAITACLEVAVQSARCRARKPPDNGNHRDCCASHCISTLQCHSWVLPNRQH